VKESKVIFWDFDGVIKDSVAVKTSAYVQLFQPYGEKVAERVRSHHQEHGGVSRYEKIPLYLSWAGEPTDSSTVSRFCESFSKLVKQAVIDAPWVYGVREYLVENAKRQYFVLITATPQEEIEEILIASGISGCFSEVYGAPIPKTEAIKRVLCHLQCQHESALVIGDAESDFQAAMENKVPFLLRSTSENQSFREKFTGRYFEDVELESR
jgi:phosphoglycolate phosphatase-like HAD superfamily hydrolase